MSHDEPPFMPFEGREPFVFVSYAHADRKRVFEEIGRLHRLGYRIWYDHGIHVGDEWPDAIASALDRCALFLVFISAAATRSKNVRDEIHFALDHSKAIVAVHFDSGALSGGLRLRLGSVQAILKYELPEAEYQSRVRAALSASLVAQPWTTDRLDTGTILGVDFGTTNSVMGICVGVEPCLILNREGERSTPSVVAWTPNGQWLVGDAAKAQAHRNYANTFYSIKSKLGTGFAIERGGQRYHAHDMVAMILNKLREDAALYLRQEIRKVVVTHPVGFTRAQKEELVLAYQLAGFEVVRVLPEPTAVALAYADQWEDTTVAIYDLGGGSFDVSIVEIYSNDVFCKSVAGDVALGGDDFDRVLADHCLDRFAQECGFTVTDPVIYRRVLDEAERVKKVLSGAPTAHIDLPYLAFRDDKWFHLQLVVSANEFMKMTAELVNRSISKCRQALEVVGRWVNKPERVILAGLATKMPGLRSEIRSFFGLEPICHVDPADAIALGAAIQGVILETRGRGVLLVDIVPFSLGVETFGGGMESMISKNTVIPKKTSDAFHAEGGSERGVNVNVFEGERPIADDNHYLGSIQFTPQASWTAQTKFEVTFECQVGGDLWVTLSDLDTGKKECLKFLLSERRPGLDPAARPPANIQIVRQEKPPPGE